MSALKILNEKFEKGILKSDNMTPLEKLLIFEDSKYHEAAAAELAAKDAEIARLRALVKKLEWASGDEWDFMCPVCEVYKTNGGGHTSDCELAAALRGVENGEKDV